MNLNEWAKKYNVPPQGIFELLKIFEVSTDPSCDSASFSEAAVLNLVRLEASRKGARLWRNNVGAVTTSTGSFLRFGLANESAAQNKVLKSADLIGIKPLLITQEMVGTIVGQFLSREIKSSNWTYKENERSRGQLAWIKLITSLGGDAKFATKEGTI